MFTIFRNSSLPSAFSCFAGSRRCGAEALCGGAPDPAGKVRDDGRLSVQYSHIRSFVVRSGGAYSSETGGRGFLQSASRMLADLFLFAVTPAGAGVLERLLVGGPARAAPALLVDPGGVRPRGRGGGGRAGGGAAPGPAGGGRGGGGWG